MFLAYLPRQSAGTLEVLPGAGQTIDNVRQGTETSVEYTLRNRASVPIRIVHVEKDCGCAGVEVPRSDLAAGDSVTVTVKFSSGQSRGVVDVRALLAYVREGEEEPSFLPLTLRAQIDPDYAVEPERLEFGLGLPRVQRVSLSPRHVSDVRVEKAACNLRFFKVRVLPRETADREDIEVTFLPEGYYRDAGPGELLVSTNSERQPALRIPLDYSDQTAPVTADAGERGGRIP